MELQEKILSILKEHWIAVLVGLVGVVCIGYGLFSLFHSQTTETDVQFQSGQPSSDPGQSSISPVKKSITIDIEGAVVKPGVYLLSQDSRMKDALSAAGGFSQNTDKEKVAQNLNLAAPLTDGAKLYIPAVGEQMTGSSGSSSTGSDVAGAMSKTVNINQATESELDALPGIGPVTAQKIISNRPYQNAQDLVTKKAVGASEFAKIKDQISVY